MNNLLTNLYRHFADIQPTGLPEAKLETTLPSVLKIVFMVAALLSLVFVTMGGFKYTTSNGDPQGVAKAKNTIIAALVGLVIAVFAFTIVSFVTGRLS